MKVLVVKTSSMGDVIHTLPALTTAAQKIPEIQFDWVVEEGFAEIPTWHKHVNKVIPVALRRWRKNFLQSLFGEECRQFIRQLKEEHYDVVIDAQGLLKSAVLTRLSKGLRCGPNWDSAREPLASIFYQKKLVVNREQHAILRMQQIFSQALDYTYEEGIPDYGLQLKISSPYDKPYIVLLHGTTWKTKEWPETYWLELAKLAASEDYEVLLPWGNTAEYNRAQQIQSQCEHAKVLEKLNLSAIASVLAGAKAIVAVDTGLAHLAAALNVPTVSLYGATDPQKTGALGKAQVHVTSKLSCSPCLSRQCQFVQQASIFPPCFELITPASVWEKTKKGME